MKYLDYVSKLDLFGYNIKLKYKNSGSYSSNLGGLFSIFVYIFIIIQIYFSFKQFQSSLNPSVNTYEQQSSEIQSVKISNIDDKFKLGLMLVDNTSNSRIIEDHNVLLKDNSNKLFEFKTYVVNTKTTSLNKANEFKRSIRLPFCKRNNNTKNTNYKTDLYNVCYDMSEWNNFIKETKNIPNFKIMDYDENKFHEFMTEEDNILKDDYYTNNFSLEKKKKININDIMNKLDDNINNLDKFFNKKLKTYEDNNEEDNNNEKVDLLVYEQFNAHKGQYLSIELKFLCQYDKNNLLINKENISCLKYNTKDKANLFLSNISVFSFVQSRYFEEYDVDNPIQYQSSQIKYDNFYSKDEVFESNMFLVNTDFREHYNLLFNPVAKDREFYIYFKDGSQTGGYVDRHQENEDIIFKINLKTTIFNNKIVRKFLSPIDILADIGGLFSFLSFFGMLIINSINKQLFFTDMINDHFNIVKESDKGFSKRSLNKDDNSNNNSSSSDNDNSNYNKLNYKDKIYNLQNKNNIEINKLNKTNLTSNNNSNINSFKVSIIKNDCKKQVVLENNSNFQEQDKILINKKEYYEDIKNNNKNSNNKNNNFIKEKALNHKFVYELKDIIIGKIADLLFCFTFKSINKKKDIFNKSKKILDNYLSLNTVIMTVQEFKIMRSVMFDSVQRKIINQYKKPVIKIYDESTVFVYRKSDVNKNTEVLNNNNNNVLKDKLLSDNISDYNDAKIKNKLKMYKKEKNKNIPQELELIECPFNEDNAFADNYLKSKIENYNKLDKKDI